MLETIARDEETWLTSRGYDAGQLLQSREQIPPLARLSVASCRKSVTSARSLAREASTASVASSRLLPVIGDKFPRYSALLRIITRYST